MAEDKEKQQRRSGPLPKLPIDRLIAVMATMDDETLALIPDLVKAFVAGRRLKPSGQPSQAMLELGETAAEDSQPENMIQRVARLKAEGKWKPGETAAGGAE